MQPEIKSSGGWKDECEQQWGIALQLLLNHLLSAGIAIGLFAWLSVLGLSSLLALGITLLIGSGLGLLLTWNIQSALGTFCETLQQLSQGISVELSEKAWWWYWPFTESFTALQTLNQQIKQHGEQIHLSREYRTQLLQQASHTADLEQRHRLACDLHAEIARQLFSLNLNAATVQAYRDHSGNLDESVQAALEDIQRNAQGVQVEMQALRQQLHAALLDHDSLEEALQTLAATLGYHTGAALQITLGELPDADRLPRSMQELIFRIVQEACDNIARHAYPQHIWLTLEQQEQALLLKIRDDGQGFDLAQVRHGIGLAQMHERTAALKGTISIKSQSGEGTTISVIVPLLSTLPEQLDQRYREWNTKHKFASILTGIQIGEWSALATLISIALYARFGNVRESRLCFSFILLFSLGSTIYGYLRAHIMLSQVALTSSEHVDELRAMRLRLRSWHLWRYRLALAGSWYLVSLLHGWHDEQIVLELAVASCGLLILLIREHGSTLYTKRQQYRQLSHIEMRWEWQCWQQRLAYQGRVWFLCVGCYILLTPVTSGINGTIQHPGIALQLFDDAPALIIVLWGLQLLLEKLISHRAPGVLLTSKDQAVLSSKGACHE